MAKNYHIDRDCPYYKFSHEYSIVGGICTLGDKETDINLLNCKNCKYTNLGGKGNESHWGCSRGCNECTKLSTGD